MEGVFNQLQGKGNNNLEFLIQWMKQAKILDAAKAEAEHRVRELFKDVPDPRNIAMDKFKQVVSQFAKEQGISVDQITSKLMSQGPAFLQMAEKMNIEAVHGSPFQEADEHAEEHEEDHHDEDDHEEDHHEEEEEDHHEEEEEDHHEEEEEHHSD